MEEFVSVLMATTDNTSRVKIKKCFFIFFKN